MLQRFLRSLWVPCLLMMLFLTGCWDRRELDDLGIVMGVGLDKNPGAKGLELTAQLVRPGGNKSESGGQSQGQGNSSQASWNVKTQGETVFQAVRHMTHLSSRMLFWAHNKVIILGEDLAREGVRKYLDFFLRDEEIYPTAWVMVAKGKAAEVLEAQPPLEKIQALNIADLAETQPATSQCTIVNLLEFSESLISPATSPVAGVLEVVEKDGEKVVHLAGTAVFKDDRLADYLDEEETRGLLWVLGEVHGGIIVIDRGEEKKLSLEIIEAKGRLIPELRDGKILVRIAIEVLSDIKEMTLYQDLFSEAVINTIKAEQRVAVQKEIEKAFQKARAIKCDIFGLGEAIRRKYPRLWRQLEDNWEQYFQELEIVLDIKSNLRRSGVTTNAPTTH